MSNAVTGEPVEDPAADRGAAADDGRVDELDAVSLPAPHRRRLGEWPLIAVIAVGALGLGIVAAGHFRRGTVVLSVSICLGALLRALLPARIAGLLAVRSRILDVALLTVLGVGTLVLALVVPPLVKAP